MRKRTALKIAHKGRSFVTEHFLLARARTLLCSRTDCPSPDMFRGGGNRQGGHDISILGVWAGFKTDVFRCLCDKIRDYEPWPATSASPVHVEYIERLLRTRESSNKRCRANPSCQILVLPFLCTWATFGVFRCHPARWDAAGPPVSGRTARCRGAAQKLRVCPCRGGYSDLANPLQAKRCRLSPVLLAEKYRVHMNELQRTPGRRRWLFGVKSKRRLWPLRPWPRVTKGFSPIVSRQGPHSGGRAPPGRGWESTFLFFSPRLHPWRLSNKRAPLTESPEGGATCGCRYVHIVPSCTPLSFFRAEPFARISSFLRVIMNLTDSAKPVGGRSR